jgi:hypothetical protein
MYANKMKQEKTLADIILTAVEVVTRYSHNVGTGSA